MVVSEIMQKDFFTVQPTESLEETAKKMREKQLGTALVLDEGHVKGILTEKEITKAIDNSGAVLRGDVINRKPAINDDGNRCCYFNDVQVELLLGG